MIPTLHVKYLTCSQRNKKRKFKVEAKSGKTLNFLFLFLLEHVICYLYIIICCYPELQLGDSEHTKLCDVHEDTAQTSSFLEQASIPLNMSVLQHIVKHKDMIVWLQDMRSKT